MHSVSIIPPSFLVQLFFLRAEQFQISQSTKGLKRHPVREPLCALQNAALVPSLARGSLCCCCFSYVFTQWHFASGQLRLKGGGVMYVCWRTVYFQCFGVLLKPLLPTTTTWCVGRNSLHEVFEGAFLLDPVLQHRQCNSYYSLIKTIPPPETFLPL